MRYRWNGVRCVAMTWLLLALSRASVGTGNAGDSPTDSQRSMHDRIRRHDPVNSTSTPRGWTSQCSPQCFGNVSALQLKRNYRLDSVRDDILRKLRMNQPPNNTGRIPNIPAVQNLLSQVNVEFNASEHNMDLDSISPTTFILLSQVVPPDRRSSFPSSCYFNFSPDLRDDQVITAQLGIYIKLRHTVVHASQNTTPVTWLLVYRISRNPEGRFYKTLQRRRVISLTPRDTGRWQFFDAKPLVEYWMRHPGQNYGIQIIASDFRGEPLSALPTSNQNDNGLMPYIEIQILSQPSNRPRRSTESDCVEANADPRCCRYPLTIDFDVFRWDWVIAPKRYEAYYCYGECPFLYYQRQTHTHVISQLAGGLGVPCCAPALMSSLQMIYIDSSHNIVFGTLPGMIVERCGCA